VVDAGGEAQVEMLIDDLARDGTDVLVTNARIIGPLRRRISAFGEAERAAVFEGEVFLLETEPRALIVENGRALVRRVRGLAVG
jgi:hypothetical protein